MPDREDVIRSLINCISDECDCVNKCQYFKQADCLNSLMRDAAQLLKAQEPRLITREELKQFEDSPCWFESHGTYMGKEGFWIIPYMFTCYQTMYYVFPLLSANERGNMHYSELGLSAYNKAWRCWSARPTPEQQKAVKWE